MKYTPPEYNLQDSLHLTVDDVSAVRQTLLHFVPVELADVILQAAKYWPKHVTTNTCEFRVLANRYAGHPSAYYYLISEPIPQAMRDGQAIPTKVKSVKFSMSGCDQGYGGDRSCQGTYRNSWSWFEASIIKPQSQFSENLDKLPVDISKHFIASFPLNSPSPTMKTWPIQRNIHVSRHKQAHEVIWIDEDLPIDVPDFDDGKGRGSGKGFVKSLQVGDRVGLIACALYPGWENNVQNATVEICFQA